VFHIVFVEHVPNTYYRLYSSLVHINYILSVTELVHVSILIHIWIILVIWRKITTSFSRLPHLHCIEAAALANLTMNFINSWKWDPSIILHRISSINMSVTAVVFIIKYVECSWFLDVFRNIPGSQRILSTKEIDTISEKTTREWMITLW
jgi:hypothetical protein